MLRPSGDISKFTSPAVSPMRFTIVLKILNFVVENPTSSLFKGSRVPSNCLITILGMFCYNHILI